MAEIGHVLHFSVADLLGMPVSDLLAFHRQAVRLSGVNQS